MNPELRRSAAHVFVEMIDAPQLTDEDAHHLGRVLRLRAGEQVSVSDGAGRWRMCTFTAATGVPLESFTPVQQDAPPQPPITVGFALAKGDRPEWIVQKLTEIGIDRIVLVDATRSIVRWDPAKAVRNLERLGKVAREAAMQSRRTWLPQIAGPFALADLAVDGVAIAEPDGPPLEGWVHTLLVGPEGGWAEAELAVAPRRVGLGNTILRVETAAVVAAAQLVALRDRSATQ